MHKQKRLSTAQAVLNLRRSMGLSQEGFAKAFTINSRTISRFESGTRTPTGFLLLAFAAYSVERHLAGEGNLFRHLAEQEMKHYAPRLNFNTTITADMAMKS